MPLAMPPSPTGVHCRASQPSQTLVSRGTFRVFLTSLRGVLRSDLHPTFFTRISSRHARKLRGVFCRDLNRLRGARELRLLGRLPEEDDLGLLEVAASI